MAIRLVNSPIDPAYPGAVFGANVYVDETEIDVGGEMLKTTMGSNVIVFDNVFIGAATQIANDVVICQNVVIRNEVVIGNTATIGVACIIATASEIDDGEEVLANTGVI